MPTTTNYRLDFVCGCTYNHNEGDTYCADHMHEGEPTADNPPAERRWLNSLHD